MEEFAPIIMIIIISLVSGLVRKSKQTAQQRQQAARRIQANLREEMRQEEEKLKAKILEEKKQEDIWNHPAAPAYTPVTPPAPAKMNGEGRDDCHAYMLDNPIEVSAAVETVTDEERERAANDLLRGVIVSEILNRPRPLKGRRA